MPSHTVGGPYSLRGERMDYERIESETAAYDDVPAERKCSGIGAVAKGLLGADLTGRVLQSSDVANS